MLTPRFVTRFLAFTRFVFVTLRRLVLTIPWLKWPCGSNSMAHWKKVSVDFRHELAVITEGVSAFLGLWGSADVLPQKRRSFSVSFPAFEYPRVFFFGSPRAAFSLIYGISHESPRRAFFSSSLVSLGDLLR